MTSDERRLRPRRCDGSWDATEAGTTTAKHERRKRRRRRLRRRWAKVVGELGGGWVDDGRQSGRRRRRRWWAKAVVCVRLARFSDVFGDSERRLNSEVLKRDLGLCISIFYFYNMV
nr:hypothetical protein Iba_chr12cCG14200 [Ipomoea batatas]